MESSPDETDCQSSLRILSGEGESYPVENEVSSDDRDNSCNVKGTAEHPPMQEQDDDIEPVGDVPMLLKKYLDTMSHVFEGYSEVFKQSDEHESFVIDKIEKVEETAKEHLKELVRSKQAHFEKLNMLSATLSLNNDP